VSFRERSNQVTSLGPNPTVNVNSARNAGNCVCTRDECGCESKGFGRKEWTPKEALSNKPSNGAASPSPSPTNIEPDPRKESPGYSGLADKVKGINVLYGDVAHHRGPAHP